jgi:hypothetical protein
VKGKNSRHEDYEEKSISSMAYVHRLVINKKHNGLPY